MPICVNMICKEYNGNISNEPIMVTIALEEYRSLIEDNARLNNDLCNSQSEYWRLNGEFEKLKEMVGEDK